MRALVVTNPPVSGDAQIVIVPFSPFPSATGLASFTKVAGDGQKGEPFTVLAQKFVTRLLDSSGQPVVGRGVEFIIDPDVANSSHFKPPVIRQNTLRVYHRPRWAESEMSRAPATLVSIEAVG